ncbi:MAG: hypothetical protein CH6_0125 [Candidatus Kapaibacterium sp.]|nr:MAG: hypothetical protein CH6_0125 [Candidatus Kapabacteria bacterium]
MLRLLKRSGIILFLVLVFIISTTFCDNTSKDCDCDALRRRIQELEYENEQLRQMETKIDELKEQINELEDKNQELEDQLQDLEN